MVATTYNPNTWEAKVKGFRIQDQPSPHSKFLNSYNYIVRP